jgi:hypothetical protein
MPGILGTALSQPYLKRWTQKDDEAFGPPADRRKPRTYASLKPGIDCAECPLDFCLWLHRNFDGLVIAINGNRLGTFQAW